MIELKALEKTYMTSHGAVTALKNIHLSIKKGEIYGIIGLSGAGKSTLIRCINMLEVPTKGTVLVDGKDLTKMSDSELREARKGIGMIFQHFNLLSSATVYDNVAFPLRLAGTNNEMIRQKVTPLLELVGLSDKAGQYPAQLSGGQKQRVGIARALASDPKVLLCDEATSALDPQTTKSILSLILDINKKLDLTVVIITHEMQVIKDICDKVAVIEHGVIAEEGPVLEVFTNPQQDITKDFISVLLTNDLPPSFQHKTITAEPSFDSSLLVRLTFLGKNTNEPVIADIIRNFRAEVSILSGTIDSIKGSPYGRLLIGLKGEPIELNRILAHLRALDLRLEVLGYVS